MYTIRVSESKVAFTTQNKEKLAFYLIAVVHVHNLFVK